MVDSLSEEIDGLLRQLSKANDDMTEISTSTPGLTPALVHTLQRHRDILQDYSQEFRKTQNNLKSRREREELLTGVKKEIEFVLNNYYFIFIVHPRKMLISVTLFYSSSSKNALNRRMDMYMKENDHLVR